jgi:hypothetical protein
MIHTSRKKILGLSIIVVCIIGLAGSFYFSSHNASQPDTIHAEHLKLAQQAQNNSNASLQGDTTKRFSLDANYPDVISPGQNVTLSFKIFDAASGNQVILFNNVYSKLMHLVVVDSTLTYFNHIHPDYKNGVFTITTQFPKAGVYHLYTDFQPIGAIEQQIGFTIQVGDIPTHIHSTSKPDANTTKTFGEYDVTFNAPQLVSSDLSVGKQLLSFTIADSKTKQPVTTLKPYLEAFGHLVMINQNTYEYIHVHPNAQTTPNPDDNGGPTVTFMPLGLNGPIKPGIYRVFAQFNPNDELMTADFTVEVK